MVLLGNRVCAGFPSPAEDLGGERIDNHIVVAVVDGDFTVKRLHQRAGRIKLKAANPTFADTVPKDGQTLEIWGVVTSSIKQFPV